MTLNVVPLIQIKQLVRISPSRYFSLKLCALHEIWSSQYCPSLIPVSPSVQLGTIIHKLLETCNNGSVQTEGSLEKAWENAVQAVETEMKNNPLERYLLPLKDSTYNYEVKRIMAFMIAKEILKNRGGYSFRRTGVQTGSEVWLESRDGFVGGRADFIQETQGALEIIDYKTGAVTDSVSDKGQLKPEYAVQLKLYAALHHEVCSVWAARATVIGLDNKRYSIEVVPEECMQLLQEAKKCLEDTNVLIEAGAMPEDLATPSSAACHYCGYRPACTKYWQARKDDEAWPLDTRGEMKSKKVLGNGLIKLEIAAACGTISVRGLSDDKHTFLKNISSEVLICNLVQDTIPLHFVEGQLTVGYALS